MYQNFLKGKTEPSSRTFLSPLSPEFLGYGNILCLFASTVFKILIVIIQILSFIIQSFPASSFLGVFTWCSSEKHSELMHFVTPGLWAVRGNALPAHGQASIVTSLAEFRGWQNAGSSHSVLSESCEPWISRRDLQPEWTHFSMRFKEHFPWLETC